MKEHTLQITLLGEEAKHYLDLRQDLETNGGYISITDMLYQNRLMKQQIAYAESKEERLEATLSKLKDKYDQKCKELREYEAKERPKLLATLNSEEINRRASQEVRLYKILSKRERLLEKRRLVRRLRSQNVFCEFFKNLFN